MLKKLNPIVMSLFLLAPVGQHALAEVLFVDPVKGNDDNRGTFEQPVASLAKAVAVANALTGEGPITIKLSPGAFVLTDKVSIIPRESPGIPPGSRSKRR
jgi:hypothetical protein